MMILILLAVSFVAAIILAFVGDRRFAHEINIIGSAVTFFAGLGLAVQVNMQGPMLAGGKFFLLIILMYILLSLHPSSHLQPPSSAGDICGGRGSMAVWATGGCGFIMLCFSSLSLPCSLRSLQTMLVSYG